MLIVLGYIPSLTCREVWAIGRSGTGHMLSLGLGSEEMTDLPQDRQGGTCIWPELCSNKWRLRLSWSHNQYAEKWTVYNIVLRNDLDLQLHVTRHRYLLDGSVAPSSRADNSCGSNSIQ